MKKLALVTKLSFSVELTYNQFLSMEKRDDFLSGHVFFKNRNFFGLLSIIEELTHAYDIEYNGHFGSYVFFTLDKEHEEESEIIAKIIKHYSSKKSYSAIFDISKEINRKDKRKGYFECFLENYNIF